MKNSYKKSYRKAYKKPKARAKKGAKAFKVPAIAKAAIIVAVALLAVFISLQFFSYREERGKAKSSTHTDQTMPYIAMLSKKGHLYNKLTAVQGNDFANLSEAEALTILPADRKQKIRISLPKEAVEDVSYQIRRASNGDLLEQSQVDMESLEGGDSYSEISLPIKNLIMPSNTYKLEIKLKTNDGKSLLYTTRLELYENSYLDEKLAYVKKVTEAMYKTNEQSTKFLMKALRPDENSTDNNYAVANMTSRLALLRWSGFNPKYNSDAIPTLQKIDRTSTRITQSYPIEVTVDGATRRVIVNEMFAVRLNANKEEVIMDYERKASESLLTNNLSITTLGLRIGFSPDESITKVQSPSGEYVAFVNGGNLWQIVTGKGKEDNSPKESGLTRIFSFGDEKSNIYDIPSEILLNEKDDIIAVNNAYDIDIVSVKDNGDVRFIIYGTFQAGSHYGLSGIGAYEYKASSGSLVELAFIPISGSTSQLKKLASSSYISDEGDLFILKDKTLSRINGSNMEVTKLAENVQAYSFSKDRSLVAFMTKGDVKKDSIGKTIHIYDMENEKEATMSVADGSYINLCGYLYNNLAVANLNEGDLVKEGGREVSYYNSFSMLDSNAKLIKEYKQNGSFYSNITISGSTMSFDIYKKEKDTFKKTGSNKLIGLEEETKLAAKAERIAGNQASSFMWLIFADGIKENTNVDVKVITDFIHDDKNIVDLR